MSDETTPILVKARSAGLRPEQALKLLAGIAELIFQALHLALQLRHPFGEHIAGVGEIADHLSHGFHCGISPWGDSHQFQIYLGFYLAECFGHGGNGLSAAGGLLATSKPGRGAA